MHNNGMLLGGVKSPTMVTNIIVNTLNLWKLIKINHIKNLHILNYTEARFIVSHQLHPKFDAGRQSLFIIHHKVACVD